MPVTVARRRVSCGLSPGFTHERRMTASTRSDLLFAALASAATYGLAGTVPAAVVGVVTLVASFGVSAPLSALRDAAGALWRSVRGGVSSVPSMRGAEVGLRWLLVVFMAGLLVGRGGIAIPRIVLPDIDWPVIDIDWTDDETDPDPEPEPEPTGPLTAVVVYETDEPLSRTQYTGLYDPELKSYIASHFDLRGNHAEWRIFDDDGLSMSEESPEVSAAYQQATTDASGKPWIVIRRAGATVHSGELPADGAGLLSLLKQFGGE